MAPNVYGSRGELEGIGSAYGLKVVKSKGTSYSLVQDLAVGCASFGVIVIKVMTAVRSAITQQQLRLLYRIVCSIVSIDCFDL